MLKKLYLFLLAAAVCIGMGVLVHHYILISPAERVENILESVKSGRETELPAGTGEKIRTLYEFHEKENLDQKPQVTISRLTPLKDNLYYLSVYFEILQYAGATYVDVEGTYSGTAGFYFRGNYPYDWELVRVQVDPYTYEEI